ncbi:MAG: RNA methyltransferase [Firmicutes bacterium]|nr:RNA methyltransferase [Bacillota bacterium]
MNDENRGGRLLIKSRQNARILEAARLDEPKYRRADGLFLVDGIKLFREALSSGYRVKHVFLAESAASKYENELRDTDVYLVSDCVFEKITDERAPEGVVGVVYADGEKYKTLADGDTANKKIDLVLDGIQNPENLGAILRSANAFGAEGVLLLDTADPFGRKALRASMGAAMRLRLFRAEREWACRNLSGSGRLVAAALDERSVPLGEFDFAPDDIVVIGNEGHGISPEIFSACGASVKIPMRRGQESLNAAVASSLILWERYKSRGFPE